MSDKDNPIVITSQLSKDYEMGNQTVHALKNVDVVINSGEFIAVMGPSGSGKSTFMNLLGCLDTATSGSIELDGRDVSELSVAQLALTRNQKIGFVFQQFNLQSRTSALDNVSLPLLYSNCPESEFKPRALKCLEIVGLSDRAVHHPSQLSGGQQQRVAIARALINDPILLFADEPTGALDTETGLEIMVLFQQLNRQGKTIIMVTHEVEIADFANRQLRFRDGQLLSDEQVNPQSAIDVLEAFRHEFKQQELR